MTVDELFKGKALHRDWTATVLRRAKWGVLGCALLGVFVELMRPTRSTWRDLLIYLAFPAWWLSAVIPLAWPPNPIAERDGSGFVLRYWRGSRRGFRAFLILPWALITMAMLPSVPKDPWAAVGLLGIALASVAFAILISRESFRVTDSEVQRKSPWTGRVTSIRWRDVTRCEVEGWPRLVLAGHGPTLKVPLVFEGSGDFAAQVLTTLPHRSSTGE